MRGALGFGDFRTDGPSIYKIWSIVWNHMKFGLFLTQVCYEITDLTHEHTQWTKEQTWISFLPLDSSSFNPMTISFFHFTIFLAVLNSSSFNPVTILFFPHRILPLTALDFSSHSWSHSLFCLASIHAPSSIFDSRERERDEWERGAEVWFL